MDTAANLIEIRNGYAPNSAYTRGYPKVSGLAAWSENCKWYNLLVGEHRERNPAGRPKRRYENTEVDLSGNMVQAELISVTVQWRTL
jgi:hypothetical protein